MKNDREALAGYVAECWCAAWLGKHFGTAVVHEFGSKVDKVMKFDCCLYTEELGDMLVDVKASISHPNCLLEASHPAFLKSNLDGHRWFGFPFRDLDQIVLVKSTSEFLEFLGQDSVQKYETQAGKSHYVVKCQQLINFSKRGLQTVCIQTDESFGQFFNSHFSGNELASLRTSAEITQFVKDQIQPVCNNHDI